MGRGPVVHLDRLRKAKMIEAILIHATGGPIADLNILDIGGGNGDIAEYFAHDNQVTILDVDDQRRTAGRARFHQAIDEEIPFGDNAFDIVLSHHVIEHIQNQRRHLLEIRRVMAASGLAYLATPNKSSPLMEGHRGNKQVLFYAEMGPLLSDAGFLVEEYGWRVAKFPETFYSEVRAARVLPAAVVKRLAFLFPSHMFVMRPR